MDILERLPETTTFGLLDVCGDARIVLRRHEHDRRLEPSPPHTMFQLETANAGQADIDDQAIGVVLVVEVCLGRFERMDEVAVGAKSRPIARQTSSSSSMTTRASLEGRVRIEGA